MKEQKITAAILAGGKSTRMKSDKLFLPIGRSSLLRKTIEFLEDIFDQVMIVSSSQAVKSRLSHKWIVSDEYIGYGPLAGIQAALKSCNSSAVFVFASDMPNLNPELIKHMLSRFRKEYDVLVPSHREGLEPLHAIYSRNCLEVIESQLNQRILPIRMFFPAVRVKYLDLPPEKIPCFFNVNTPADLKKIIG